MEKNVTFHRSILKDIYLLLITLLTLTPLHSHSQEKAPIVIVSSYNPDAVNISNYISDFLNEYKLKERDRSVIVENMNCKAFSESPLWTETMSQLIRKCESMKPAPAAIILLAQEAFVSYLSQSKPFPGHIPVFCAMVSRNTVQFPNRKFNPFKINLKHIDAFTLSKKYNLVGGYLYEYDIESNIKLIKEFYPSAKELVFVTDNSCGGVCLLSYINHVMARHHEYKYVSLDGRSHTVYAMINELAKLPKDAVAILGTWRVDKSEGFFMHNSAYLMKDANPKLPVFSLSTIGVGNWAIGGCTPDYRNTGKEMAQQVYDYIHLKNHGVAGLKSIPQKYVFDVKALAKFGIKLKAIPHNSELINKEDNFWVKNAKYIIITAILIAIIIFLTYFLWKTNRLQNTLIKSQIDLLEAKERAEEANKLKSAFLANMSHEIRTPLNAIVGFSNLMTTTELSVEDRTEYSKIIQQNSDVLLNLINDILDLSRLESNHINFYFEKIDVIDLCKSSLMTAKVARPSNLEYKFESRFEQHVELIDMQRIQQILNNLLSNAAKFTKEGSITLAFDIDEKKHHMIFSVTDTGCGISEENRVKIFERFEKLNSYVQGTGLGLSICKITIERLGGKIWVDPDYTQGSRFVFYIPIRTEN